MDESAYNPDTNPNQPVDRSVSPMGEQALVAQMVQGDSAAFTEIYSLYQDKIFAFALRLVKDREVAQDMVQEIFIKLWEKRALVKAELSFGAYLRKMAQNHLFNYLKKASLDRGLQSRVQSTIHLLQTTEPSELLEKELKKAYLEAVEQLSPQRKAVYLLCKQEDLSYEDIAQRLGLSRNTVRNHMVEALKSIREHVRKNTDLQLLLLAIHLHG